MLNRSQIAKIMQKITAIGFAAAVMTPALSYGGTWTIDSANSRAGFVAIGSPGFLRITGEGGHVSGNATSTTPSGAKEQVTGTFEVNLSELTTGMSLRDRHMKEKYLETGKFPVATLTIDALSLPADSSEQSSEFTGMLTLKGVTKKITGQAKLARISTGIKVDANFAVNLNDYPVGVPSWLGVTVAEKVDIEVSFQARGASTH